MYKSIVLKKIFEKCFTYVIKLEVHEFKHYQPEEWAIFK